jgi:hypothetical protein
VGEWRTVEISYLKPNRTFCELCGQLLAGRFWSVDGKVFCGPDHERKYETYWLPRYGKGQ